MVEARRRETVTVHTEFKLHSVTEFKHRTFCARENEHDTTTTTTTSINK